GILRSIVRFWLKRVPIGWIPAWFDRNCRVASFVISRSHQTISVALFIQTRWIWLLESQLMDFQTGVPGLSPQAASTAVDMSGIITTDSTAAVKACVSSLPLVVVKGLPSWPLVEISHERTRRCLARELSLRRARRSGARLASPRYNTVQMLPQNATRTPPAVAEPTASQKRLPPARRAASRAPSPRNRSSISAAIGGFASSAAA